MTRQLLEGLRKLRRPEPFVIPGQAAPIYVQSLSGLERMEFGDYMAELDIEFKTDADGKQVWEGGQSSKAFRIALFVCSHGIVDEHGRKQVESLEDAERLLGDIEPQQIVFDIAQRIMDISGMSSGSKEAAEKN